MLERFPLIRWVAFLALADWLITRTLVRLAIHMPKSPLMVQFYQVFTWIGMVASSMAALLTLSAILWLAWHIRQNGKGLISFFMVVAFVYNLAFLVAVPEGWPLLGFYLIVSVWLIWQEYRIWIHVQETSRRLAVLMPGLALLLGISHHGIQAWHAAYHLPGPFPISATIFNLGELLAVLSPIGLWWIWEPKPKRTDLSVYIWALLPALAFSLLHWRNPTMAGILAIWSTGLTLYLPWPLYGLSLWLAAVIVLKSRRDKPARALAVILLAAGGYAPQLSTQVFWGLMALNLLAASVALPCGVQANAEAGTGAQQWMYVFSPEDTN